MNKKITFLYTALLVLFISNNVGATSTDESQAKNDALRQLTDATSQIATHKQTLSSYLQRLNQLEDALSKKNYYADKGRVLAKFAKEYLSNITIQQSSAEAVATSQRYQVASLEENDLAQSLIQKENHAAIISALADVARFINSLIAGLDSKTASKDTRVLLASGFVADQTVKYQQGLGISFPASVSAAYQAQSVNYQPTSYTPTSYVNRPTTPITSSQRISTPSPRSPITSLSNRSSTSSGSSTGRSTAARSTSSSTSTRR